MSKHYKGFPAYARALLWALRIPCIITAVMADAAARLHDCVYGPICRRKTARDNAEYDRVYGGVKHKIPEWGNK